MSRSKRQVSFQDTIGKRKAANEDDDLLREGLGIGANEDLDMGGSDEEYVSSEDEFAHETADERRVRMARSFLEQIDGEVSTDSEDDNSDDDSDDEVHRKLTKSLRKAKGEYRESKALSAQSDVELVHTLGGHSLSVTCTAVSLDEESVFSGSKDGSVIQWDIATGKKTHVIKWDREGVTGSSDAVLSIDTGSSELVTFAGSDRKVRVWDTRDSRIHTLEDYAHKSAITSVRFRPKSQGAVESLEVVSTSTDRMVKLWNVSNYSYIDSLYGHQSAVCSLEFFSGGNLALTSGQDGTARVWKLEEDSQLLFETSKDGTAADACCILDELRFLTGTQSGNLFLWSRSKRKPVAYTPAAHGNDQWISALAAHPFSDLVVSGASSGAIKLWSVNRDITHAGELEAAGFVNELRVSNSGSLIVAALGKEHKLGRWNVHHSARNCLKVYRIK